MCIYPNFQNFAVRCFTVSVRNYIDFLVLNDGTFDMITYKRTAPRKLFDTKIIPIKSFFK